MQSRQSERYTQPPGSATLCIDSRLSRHSETAATSAQLRYMRMLALQHRTDVGPACCAAHATEWISDMGGTTQRATAGSE